MSEEIKLKRFDLRLNPNTYSITGTVLDSPDKVVEYARDITKSMKAGQIALFNLTAKGSVLNVIITTKRTISNMGPGLAAVIRESLLSNCSNTIAVEKSVKTEIGRINERFVENFSFVFKECSIDILDYIRVAPDDSYVSMKEKNTDFFVLYLKGKENITGLLKDNNNRKYDLFKSSLELVKTGEVFFGKDIVHVTDALDAVIEEIRFNNRENVCVIAIADKKSIGYSVVSVGTVNTSLASVGDILRCLISMKADSFIMLHNHPSSVPEPSTQDDDMTVRMINASRLGGIEMLDHLIVGGITGNYYSYAEERGKEYGLRKWSDIARETSDKDLINWFSNCQYSTVRMALLENPFLDVPVIERLTNDKHDAIRNLAKEKLDSLSEAGESVKNQIEIYKEEKKVAENDRIYNYRNALVKGK